MNQLEFYKVISKSELTIFTSKDIARLINKTSEYTKVFLSRVKKNNLLQYIERGKYCKVETSEYEVASNILVPSYISFLSALSIQGLTDQIPVEISLVALRQKASFTFNNYRIHFSTFPIKLFFGYSKQDNIFIADPEKAILDSLYLNVVPLNEIVKILNEADLNIEKLIDYSLKMGSKVLLKRIGYILEVLEIREHKELLSKVNNKRYDVLNPSLPLTGNKSKKWHLLINEDII